MATNLLPGTSEVRYARNADAAALAYRVIDRGSGGRDIVLVLAGTMPMDAIFEDPVALRFLQGLADLGRLVLFDRCGIGMSDPPDAERSGLTQWMEDLHAVVAATGVAQPVLVTAGLSAGVAMLYANRHRREVSSIVMMEPTHRAQPDPDIYPNLMDDRQTLLRKQINGEIDSVSLWCPSRAEEPGFREWFDRAGQRGASPALASRAYPGRSEEDMVVVDDAASQLQTATLLLRRPAHPISPPWATDPILALVPEATRIDLPGEDMWFFGGDVDALIAEITRFVTGEHRVPAPQRVMAVILFSDLVGSTDHATALGDERWKRLLDRHDEIARLAIGRRGGVVVKNMGDGLVATLVSVDSAVRAAQELRAALSDAGLEVRIGIHVGDIDLRGDDISGVGVVIASRVEALAAPGEILVSSTAMQAATGGAHTFEPRGEHNLKGVPGTWPVAAVITRGP